MTFSTYISILSFLSSIGRRKAFEISAILQLAAALGIAWAPNFWVYVLLEFAVGAACHGVFMSSCVLGKEFIYLTLSQMTDFRLLQTERLCR